MPTFGTKSKQVLSELHPKLQEILTEAIRYRDFSLIEGFRSEERQNQLFAEGKSKLKFPHSRHNLNPSIAVDIWPYPRPDWQDMEAWRRFAEWLRGFAEGRFNLTLINGLDWDGDWDTEDKSFNDAPHFELPKGFRESP